MVEFLNSIGGLGIFIGAVAYAYKSYKAGGNDFDKTAITNLQSAMSGLETKNELLKEENDRLRSEIKDQIQLQGKMSGELKVLQALAQGTPAIENFEKRFNEVIAEFRKDIELFKSGQERIIDILRNNK